MVDVSASDVRTFTESASVDPQNVYSISFTAGPDGGAYSGATTTGSSTITHSAANAFDGAYGGKVSIASGGTAYITGTASQNGSTHYARWYIRFPSGSPPSVNFVLAHALNSSSTVLNTVRLNATTGTISLLNGATVVATTSADNVTGFNEWQRIEWDITGTTQTLRIFRTGSTSTALETISGAANNTSIDTLRFGNPTAASTTYTYYIDEIAGNPSRTPGVLTGDILFVEDFENGVSGNSVAATTTSFNTITGTNAAFSSTQKYAGSLSMKSTSSTATSFGKWNLAAATTTLYTRFYFRVDTQPPGTVFLSSVYSGATLRNQLGINSLGKLFIYDATASTLIATGLSTSTWYRIEWDIVGGTTQTLRYYIGDSTTPVETISRAANALSFSSLNIGNDSATSQTFVHYLDAVKVSSSDNPGAIAPAASASDTFAATESASVVQVISAAETGTGTDAVTARTATIAGTETAAGVDASSVTVPLSDGDAGSGADAASLAAAVSAAETGAATEQARAENSTPVDEDSGAFTEVASLLATKTDGDALAATDSPSAVAMPVAGDGIRVRERTDLAMSSWRFTPPSRPDVYQVKGSLLVTIDTGYTVLKNGASYSRVSDPLAEDLASADIVYLGGRSYRVDDAEIAALAAAGYGGFIALMPDPS